MVEGIARNSLGVAGGKRKRGAGTQLVVLGVVVTVAFAALGAFIYYTELISLSGDDHNPKHTHVCGFLDRHSYKIYSELVYVEEHGLISATIEVTNGIISDVYPSGRPEPGPDVIDYGINFVLPGFIDIHVHLNEPGRADWEGFDTGTKAAAAGGFSTIVDMPLNSHPTTTSAKNFELKKKAAKGKLHVDVGFWGGLVPENADDPDALDELLSAGVLGLKSFLVPSGINDFPATNETHIRSAIPFLRKYDVPVFIHAEMQPPGYQESYEGDPTEYETYLKTRPPEWERTAIEMIVRLADEEAEKFWLPTPHFHIAHLSDAGSLPLVAGAHERRRGVTAETCPHYLYFSAEDIPRGSTLHKCAPPIRDADNREALWAAVVDGTITSIGSDHSPAPKSMKHLATGNFMKAWGGINGLQMAFPVVYTSGFSHGLTYDRLVSVMSKDPAKIARIKHKGAIAPGYDADFAVIDIHDEYTLNDKSTFFHKNKETPYWDMTYFGHVVATYVRGQKVFNNGKHWKKPCGEIVLSEEAMDKHLDPRAEELLEFFFREAVDKKELEFELGSRWFLRNETLDAIIREKYTDLVEHAESGDLHVWTESPHGILALIIIFDQLPRHIWRDQARAYDPFYFKQALALARRAIRANDDKKLNHFERLYVYVVFMHSEVVAHHDEGLEAWNRELWNLDAEKAGKDRIYRAESAAKLAERAKGFIIHYGRFPSRNKALGRHNTHEEDLYQQHHEGDY